MELGFTRRNIGRLLLLAWAMALAWLARRQFGDTDSATMTRGTTRLAPGAHYFAVYAGSRQIGQLNLAVDTTLDGVRLTELFVLDVPEGDSTEQQASGTEYILSRSLRLKSLTRTVFGHGTRERLIAELGTDSILRAQNIEGQIGTAPRLPMRVAIDAILPVMLPYRIAFGGELETGAQFIMPLLDLASGHSRPMRVRITAESTFVVPDSAAWDSGSGTWVSATSDTVVAFRLEHDGFDAPTATWVDPTGAVIRSETAGGLTFIRTAFEIVRNNYHDIRVAESSSWRRAVPGMMPLTGSGETLDTVASVRWYLRQPDSGATVTGMPNDLAGGRQQVRGDTVVVYRTAPPDSASRNSADSAGALGASWETPHLVTGNILHRAVDGATSRMDSAARLTRWVAQQIAIDSSGAAPVTAPATLKARRGGADGKARLLASLARMSGIPARVVTGIAVTRGGNFGHAWTELWVGGWVAADPTYGHFPASTSLVRVATGRRSDPVDLLRLTASARFLPLRRPP